MLRTLFACVLLGLIAAWAGPKPDRAPDVDTNVFAFAKLYGYVRYFHPSDEAAAIDWDRFAVHGVRSVRDAETSGELSDRLRALFIPIAPTLRVYQAENGAPTPHPALHPADTTDLKLVAWQHKGIGLGESPAYESRRLNRTAFATLPPSYAYLQQVVDARPYRGRAIRMSARARADLSDGAGAAYVWLSESLTNGQPRILGGPEPPMVQAQAWQKFSLSDTVSAESDSLSIGASVTGTAKLWADDFTAEVLTAQGTWQEIPLENASFDEGAAGKMPASWSGIGKGYHVRAVEDDSEERTAQLAWTGEPVEVSGPLFEARPRPGEVLEKPLGAGLMAQLPIALYSKDGQTMPAGDEQRLALLRDALQAVDLDGLTASDEALRLANVVIAWNVLRHSYPYGDVVGLDWDRLLTATIRDAVDDEGAEDFVVTLRRMVASLEDGHGSVGHPSIREQAGLSVLPEIVEGRVIAVAVSDESQFKVGDIIKTIDGQPALERIDDAAALRSGSERWRRLIAMRGLELGPQGTSVEVVVDRDGEEIAIEAERTTRGMIQEIRPPEVSEIEDGIYYVNLDRAETAEIVEHIDAISKADGVILDLRGYPNGNHQILQYLTDRPLRSARWNVPQMIYPDQEDLVGYDTTGRWTLPPLAPRIEGTAVFLTNERAISYAESVMGIVEHYELGEIVGRPTAGTNGNINRLRLPGNFTVVYTGMRVIKHDGSQHHLVGIQPTTPLEPTIEGVRAGRDEYIERAIQVIREARRD